MVRVEHVLDVLREGHVERVLEVQVLIEGVGDEHVEVHLLAGVPEVQREAKVRQEPDRDVLRLVRVTLALKPLCQSKSRVDEVCLLFDPVLKLLSCCVVA